MNFELYLNGKEVPRLCHSKKEAQEVATKLLDLYNPVAHEGITVSIKLVKESS